mmetsp:Transcript_44059/g.133453  ORF Transcript_44059/g.133453 Transcript_44059/m.133453 type:complete len:283 (+) Transcript_44059:823-1671(+)
MPVGDLIFERIGGFDASEQHRSRNDRVSDRQRHLGGLCERVQVFQEHDERVCYGDFHHAGAYSHPHHRAQHICQTHRHAITRAVHHSCEEEQVDGYPDRIEGQNDHHQDLARQAIILRIREEMPVQQWRKQRLRQETSNQGFAVQLGKRPFVQGGGAHRAAQGRERHLRENPGRDGCHALLLEAREQEQARGQRRRPSQPAGQQAQWQELRHATGAVPQHADPRRMPQPLVLRLASIGKDTLHGEGMAQGLPVIRRHQPALVAAKGLETRRISITTARTRKT